jgi:Secretion system C-terminal sorting domain
MKKFQKLRFLFLVLISSYSIAQTGVNVTYYDGTVQAFNVTTTGKLYFEADNLNVKIDGFTAPTTIPVDIIRKITFSSALATTTFGENNHHLVLYPNPSSDVIQINSDITEDLNTKIYSLTGRLILQGVYKSGQDIDLSHLSSGLYLVQVNGLTIKFSKK